jgi:HSP90 family molecular chaperone
MDSPVMQGLIQNDYEVLIFDEPIDEYCFQKISMFEKTKLVNVAKGEFQLPQTDDDRKRQKALRKMYSPLTEWWMKLRVTIFESIEVSQRLTTDPAIVVASKYADSANMARIFNAQANQVKTLARPNEKILEINPDHPIIKELLHLVVEEPESP